MLCIGCEDLSAKSEGVKGELGSGGIEKVLSETVVDDWNAIVIKLVIGQID